jgi:glycosyltransferase involved in cell wall biosynthesis
MNVLLSAYACMPDSGSEPGISWSWATHLADRGLNVTVLTREENRYKIEPYCIAHPRKNLCFGYVTVPFKAFKPGSGMHYALWQFLAVKVARSLNSHHRFDVVHHVAYSSIHVPTQLWRLGIPTVFGPVGGGQTAPPSMLAYFGSDVQAERRRTLLTKMLRYSPFHKRWLGKMSAVLAANNDTLELIARMGRPDVRLQADVGVATDYLTMEPKRFRPDASPLRLIWVGRMLPRKALPLALDALAKVQHDAVLTIVGSGIEEPILREMIANRGLSDRVQWAGRRLTPEEVRAAYLEQDLFLFTSLRDTNGIQLIEAMALGLPVITLDLHGARDAVPNEAGIKVPVTTPAEVTNSLAVAIDRFASMSVEQKNAMSRAGWNFAQTCTWSSRAAKAEILYRELTGQRPSGPLSPVSDSEMLKGRT